MTFPRFSLLTPFTIGSKYQKIKFYDSSEQESIFAETAFPVCENVLQGYNGTIFAYGQTGTGKTHTITGILKDEKEKGIMPRAF
jgi:DNA replication protein DnaC